MSTGKVRVYYGKGRGKSSAAFGCAIHEACRDDGSVIIIEFMKRKNSDREIAFLQRLEPEIRVFRFQRGDQDYEELDDAGKHDARINMKNAVNFARKTLLTGECSLLVLDEVLGLIDYGIITEEELLTLLKLHSPETDVTITGRIIGEALLDYADEVYEICRETGER